MEQEHQDANQMITSSEITNEAIKRGYTECFRVTSQGLFAPSNDKYYHPEEISITNFYRFEGESDPEDTAILYIIETTDGIKGTLIDAYGAKADGNISRFMHKVEEITKKHYK